MVGLVCSMACAASQQSIVARIIICRIDARVTRQFDDKETIEVQHNDGTVKNFRLAEVQQMQNKGNLQWVSPAEAVKQSLDGMLRYSFLTKNFCSTSSAVCYIKYLCI